MRRIGLFLVSVVLAELFLGCSSPLPAAPSVERTPITKTIFANASWQEGGTILSSGDVLDVVSSGSWSVGPGLCSDGNGRADLRTVGRTGYAYIGDDGFEGQLIGRIGNGPPFVVGNAVSMHVPSDQSGELSLSLTTILSRDMGRALRR